MRAGVYLLKEFGDSPIYGVLLQDPESEFWKSDAQSRNCRQRDADRDISFRCHAEEKRPTAFAARAGSQLDGLVCGRQHGRQLGRCAH